MYPDATTYTGIQETLALWPLAIDSKQYALVPQIFTASPFAQLSGRNLNGTPAIVNFLVGFLANVSSQHHLGQLQVNQTGPDTADVVQYLTGSFFGQGGAAGKMYQAFGFYKDEMVRDEEGRWLVQNRVLIEYVSLLSFPLSFFNPFSAAEAWGWGVFGD